jgi:hypothetical protein
MERTIMGRLKYTDHMEYNMTNDNGNVLKECHTKMALLDSHYKSMGQEVGKLSENMQRMHNSISSFEIILDGLTQAVRKEVLPAIQNIPGMMSLAIRDHEKNDPLHAAIKDKTKRDITEALKIKMKSDHPKLDFDYTEVKKQSLMTKNRLYSAIATLIIAAASWFGGTQIQSCNDNTQHTIVSSTNE